jgi:hypothetical protein
VALVRTDVPFSLILVTLMMEVIGSSQTQVLTRATRRHIPENGIFQDLSSSFYSRFAPSPFKRMLSVSHISLRGMTRKESCKEYYSCVWQFKHYTTKTYGEVLVQIQVLTMSAILPLVPSGWEAGWAPELVWPTGRRLKFVTHGTLLPTPQSSSPKLVPIPVSNSPVHARIRSPDL